MRKTNEKKVEEISLHPVLIATASGGKTNSGKKKRKKKVRKNKKKII